MEEACPACGLDFRREGGFYLGSIYLNYGVTVLVTGAVYAAGVGLLGWSAEAALAAALVLAVLLPVLFFHHARALLLAIDATVNRGQSSPDGMIPPRALAGDDAQAGRAMGIALALILLFGLAMAVVTLSFVGLGPPADG
jgi:hypothetical protein